MGAVENILATAVQNFTKTNILIVVAAFIAKELFDAVYGVYFGSLSKFPGPKIAAFTTWYKTWVEVFQVKSWTTQLYELHEIYGPIVRVAPNELHFSNPEAYHEIYNNQNRWDKEASLYQCFGEDESSFGYLTYQEAKKRKDIMQPLFSRRAVVDMQFLIQENIDNFCKAIERQYAAGKSSDLFFGWRCFTMDTIIRFCFNRNVDAINSPDFKAPIIEAMENSLPAFLVLKHFWLLRTIVFNMPPWLSLATSPNLAGLTRLQVMLGKQVKEVISNPASLKDSPHPIIYHRLLDLDITKGEKISSRSLYDEAQALMFAGGDTTGTSLMLGCYHVVNNREVYAKLKTELRQAWPDLATAPRFEELEKLPYLTAVIRESLRVAIGVTSPLLRVTPKNAKVIISGAEIPPETIVACSAMFVHESEKIYKDPKKFDPERWLGPNAQQLAEKGLIPFSRGPRMCIGQNLAYCELYLGFAAFFRRFDVEMDPANKVDLAWRECFIPHFGNCKMAMFCKPVAS